MPEPGIRLLLLVAGEDHPKACTGRRLIRRGLVREVSESHPPSRGAVLLDPRADAPLSPADLETARHVGILGVDCSWNRLEARGGYPEGNGWMRQLRVRRRLPLLLAGNPQHFGRLGELNTAEAFASALHVLGEPDRAAALIRDFPGGGSFLELNRELLAGYSRAEGPEGIRSVEREYF